MDASRDNTRSANHAECGCSASQCGDLARMTSSPLLCNLLFGPLDSDLGRPGAWRPQTDYDDIHDDALPRDGASLSADISPPLPPLPYIHLNTAAEASQLRHTPRRPWPETSIAFTASYLSILVCSAGTCP
jgi:hypothetical protein